MAATSLIKFGPGSYHNVKGIPNFLHQGREHPKLHANTHTIIERGPLMGSCAHESCHHGGWLNEGMVAAVFSLPTEAEHRHMVFDIVQNPKIPRYALDYIYKRRGRL